MSNLSPRYQDEIYKEFERAYPSVGEVTQGEVLGSEQWHDLSGILQARLYQLSKKKDLTAAEVSFVQHSGDMAARSTQYWVERLNVKLPDAESAPRALAIVDNILSASRRLEGSSGHSDAAEAKETLNDPRLFIDRLATVPASMIDLKSNPDYRAAAEDYAIAITQFIPELAKANNGLPVDRYLEGNLRNIIAHYELTEAE